VDDARGRPWCDTHGMKLYEVTVMYRDDQRIEREVWEIKALSESEARRIARSKVGTGQVLSVKDTLLRS